MRHTYIYIRCIDHGGTNSIVLNGHTTTQLTAHNTSPGKMLRATLLILKARCRGYILRREQRIAAGIDSWHSLDKEFSH